MSEAVAPPACRSATPAGDGTRRGGRGSRAAPRCPSRPAGSRRPGTPSACPPRARTRATDGSRCAPEGGGSDYRLT